MEGFGVSLRTIGRIAADFFVDLLSKTVGFVTTTFFSRLCTISDSFLMAKNFG